MLLNDSLRSAKKRSWERNFQSYNFTHKTPNRAQTSIINSMLLRFQKTALSLGTAVRHFLPPITEVISLLTSRGEGVLVARSYQSAAITPSMIISCWVTIWRHKALPVGTLSGHPWYRNTSDLMWRLKALECHSFQVNRSNLSSKEVIVSPKLYLRLPRQVWI